MTFDAKIPSRRSNRNFLWKTPRWAMAVLVVAFVRWDDERWCSSDGSRNEKHRRHGCPLASAWVTESLPRKVSNSPKQPMGAFDSSSDVTGYLSATKCTRESVVLRAESSETVSSSMDFENMEFLRDLVVASSLSYLPAAKMVSKSDSAANKKTMEDSPYYCSARLRPLAQVVDPETESGATVFSYRDNDTLVVACRGSATPINFSTNLRFRLVPLDASGEGFLVHEGFRDATNGLWKLLEPELQSLLRGGDNDERCSYQRILFTGHSLGAANALLCAAKYQQQAKGDGGTFVPVDGILTFGGPKVVNTGLAEHWNHGLLESVRVVNYYHHLDPILRQNGPLWESLGFGTVGTEILCEAYELKAYHEPRTEEENLPLAWNILDHCNYMGVFVGPRLV